MTPANKSKGVILVVDDNPANLKFLSTTLIDSGYQVRPAINGQLALTAAQEKPPDLILLDINMPGLNGYEVCQQLKANNKTCDIPVIFISATDNTFDKGTAFSVGGVDYITKPFQPVDMLARVNTHLTIRNLQRDLKKQIVELDAFAHTVAHDLKNPLGKITSSFSMLQEYATSLLDDDLKLILKIGVQAGYSMANIIDEILLLAKIRKGEVEMNPLDMNEIIEQARNRLTHLINDSQAKIIIPDSWPVALGYAPWVEEIWANYISNGLKYGGQPPHLECGAVVQADGWVCFWIKDNGQGITPEAQELLFTEFTRLNHIKIEGHGLGLSIVRRIIDKFGGQVGVESEIGCGSKFYFTLPSYDNNPPN